MLLKKVLPLLWRYLLLVTISCCCAFVISSSARAASETKSFTKPTAPENSGPNVVTEEFVWNDPMRQRDVPITVTAPPSKQSGTGEVQKLPVILFSHGLGGGRTGGRTWAAHWAANGYIVIQMQHAGSDERLWKGKSPAQSISDMRAGMTLGNLALRIGDVRFVIDTIVAKAAKGEGVFDRADVSKIGMSGHSFGAQTTLAVSGAATGLSRSQSGLDTRVKASIALSPNARNKRQVEKQFGDIRIPFMSITGTDDGPVLGDGTRFQDRLIPYQHMPAGGKYLLVFDEGDHMVFGGNPARGNRKSPMRDNAIIDNVKAATLAFWNAHLKGDATATKLLADEFKTRLALNDKFESK